MNIAYVASAFLACIALAWGGSFGDVIAAVIVAVVCVIDQAQLWHAVDAWWKRFLDR